MIMLGIHDLPLFIVSGLLLNLTPGADSLYIATRTLSQGARAGVAAALGIGAGCYFHVFAAAVGLSALLATSSVAFTFVKFLGAGYLIYIGLSLMFKRSPPPPSRETAVNGAPVSLRSVFAQGFLTNVLNPKVALFFLAFVPQFIDPSAASKPLAFLFLGTVFTVNGLLWCLCLVWLSGRLGALGWGARAGAWFGRGVGAMFVGLGVRLALSEPD